MDPLNRTYRVLSKRLKNLVVEIDKGDWSATATQLAQSVADLQQRLQENFDHRTLACPEEELDAITNQFDEHLHVIRAVQSRLSAAQSRPSTPAASTASSSAAEFRLPTIDLPTFGGNVAEWPSYAARFTDSLSHFPALTAAQKFHYLQSSLRGAARSVITAMVASDDSYHTAWELLKDKYDNKKTICHELVRRILNLPITNTSESLIKMVDTVREVLRTLKLMGRQMDGDVWLVPYLSTKLPRDLLQNWERSAECPKKEIPELSAMLDFLQDCATSTCFSPAAATTATASTSAVAPRKQDYKRRPCLQCSGEHHLYQCPVFLKATVQDRWLMVKKHKVCGNCLLAGHRHTDCQRLPCAKCGKRHNSRLHSSAKQEAVCTTITPKVTVLSTATVTFIGQTGPVQARVLLDTGATASYLHKDVLAKLRKPSKKCSTTLATIHGESTVKTTSTELEVKELRRYIKVMACSSLPTVPIAPVAVPDEFRSLELADKKFMTPGPLQGILGADVFGSILRGPPKTAGCLTALDTELGWVIVGGASQSPATATVFATADQAIQKFFELEEIPRTAIRSPEEEAVETNYTQTTRILPDGRFEVHIPIKPNIGALSDNLQVAVARLKSMEKRMECDDTFKTLYQQQMTEAIKAGHMVPINKNQTPSGLVSYLPHHGVISKSTTTKLRVVFDASAKSGSGGSLNELMPDAPKTQGNLFEILLRFRSHTIALTADIKQMYKQIWVSPDQRDLQRVVWRADPKKPISHYQLATIVWGTKSATYLATRTLNEIAQKSTATHPAACKSILKDFYVDDALTGGDTREEVAELQKQLSSLMGKYGFELHKWACSDPSILSESSPVRSKSITDEPQQCSALGIAWDVSSDAFTFNITLEQLQKVTKRAVLSQTGTIFDPMGWLAPLVIRPKMFIQALWHERTDWDKKLTEAQSQHWVSIIKDLNKVKAIAIPRRIFNSSEERTLCGFCDASEKAYAAVVYCRTMTPTGPTVALVAAKTKVAPLKTISLPRLELCAAVLLANLMQTINDAFDVPLPVMAWSDSTVALAWIAGHPSGWKTFVGNRVATIHDHIPADRWRHVAGKDNPADCASRGISTAELLTHPLWWSGPTLLLSDQFDAVTPTPSTGEEKKIVTLFSAPNGDWNPWERFSSYQKMIRVQSYVFRIINNMRNPKSKLRGPLSPEEMDRATMFLLKRLQQLAFPEEYQQLAKGKPVPKSSSLNNLAPFIKDGLIRVGGRLRHAEIPEDVKHPIVLPRKHHVTECMIRELHGIHLHAGAQLLATIIKKKFWFANMNHAIKKVLHRCKPCIRWRADAAKQMMADLPAARVNPSRPFTTTGIDMAGPLTLRTQLARGTRHYKGWVAVFICFATRAVHLELVTALSTDAFLAALHRFVSRRGRPRTIMTDNGTNFQGLAKQISERQDPSTGGIRWKFNPPGAPHFGGLWEAGVKSMKYHLHRVVGETPLTYEEVATVLSRIEACLNSRPLTALTNDPADLQALTPAHFLIGGDLLSVPEQEQPPKITALKRWQLTQQMAQHFWKRWSAEYLTRLQQRPKWSNPKPNLQVGQLVLLKEDNTSPLQWKLGRITAVHPGSDQLIRSATVKTALREVQRPVVKLCPLPLE